MSIWKRDYKPADLASMNVNTIHEALGIEITQITDTTISGKMPVDERTKQPAGILHGGASVVLAESLGSIASNLIIDNERQIAVGQSITANHLRPGISGYVTGTASPIHIGRKSHLWDIAIVNNESKKVCVCRLTMAVLDK